MPGGRAYVAFTSKLDGLSTVLVKDATKLDPGAPYLELGPGRALAFAASIAAAPGGGAVSWISRTATSTRLLVQRFSYDGTTFAALTQLEVPTTGAPYLQAAALVPIEGTTYFIAWSEGTQPALRVKGRFVDLR